jgi:N-acetylglucosamine malate deacetylase 1
MKNINSTVVVFAAHPDDEILGCGGTIAKLIQKGSKVHVVFLADGESSRDDIEDIDNLILQRKNNAKKALKILGCDSIEFLDFPDNRLDSLDLLDVVKKVENFIDAFKPYTIFTHYAHDLNIDHQITHNAVVTACRPQPGHCVKELLFFEVPSSTEWNLSQAFTPNYFVDISSTLPLKINALNIYKNEMKIFPHPRSINAIEALTYFRGASSGCSAAEAFILARKIT